MKKGFVSTTLVYSFFIVFIFINVIIVLNYTRKLNYLNTINERVESEIKLNYGMCSNDSDILLCKIINDNNPVLSDSSIDFTKDSSSTNGEGLLYRTLDSNKIYYYRGKDVNNFVALGNMCFRIIRSNTSSGVRAIYYGKYSNEECSVDNGSLVSYSTSNNLYESSNVKNNLDSFYENNILKYKDYLEDSVYCADVYNSSISLKCSNYFYSVSSYNGNGKLKYPMGLVSASEVVLSGLSNSYIPNNIWTMSRSGNNIYVYNNTLVSTSYTSNAYLRGVISFKSTIKVKKGDGKYYSPYVVKL